MHSGLSIVGCDNGNHVGTISTIVACKFQRFSLRWCILSIDGYFASTMSAARIDLFTRISAKTAGTLGVDESHRADGYSTLCKQILINMREQTRQRQEIQIICNFIGNVSEEISGIAAMSYMTEPLIFRTISITIRRTLP